MAPRKEVKDIKDNPKDWILWLNNLNEEMAKGLVLVMGIGMGTTVANDTPFPQKNEKDHTSLFQHKK